MNIQIPIPYKKDKEMLYAYSYTEHNFREHDSPPNLYRFACYYENFPEDGCKHKHLEEDASM